MVASVHDGAKEILPPRALRTLKYKARAVDTTLCFGTFLRELEDKFGHVTMEIPEDFEGSGPYSLSTPTPPPIPLCAVQTPARLSMSPLTPQPRSLPTNYIPTGP